MRGKRFANPYTADGKYNAPMILKRHCLSLILLLFIWITTACSSQAEPTPSATPDPLRPYYTSTSPLLSDRTPSATPELALASPTPLTYTVVQGDTLSGIAQKFGVSLGDLLAANPGIAAATLMIGSSLTIPTTPLNTPVAGPTPVPLPLTQVDCWPSLDEGMWCFIAITNSTGDTLENVIAQISLVNAAGEIAATQTTMAMLDILPPGKSSALAAYFSAPLPEGVTPQAQLISAVRILPTDVRYAPVTSDNVLVNVGWNGLTAQISGQAVPMSGETMPEIPAGRLWLAATAYDAKGRVVGVRRWESDAVMPAGGTLPFSFQISSMGPEIDRVELLAEARP
jgi:LysM repeat protein